MNTRIDQFCVYLKDNMPMMWPAVNRNRARNTELFTDLGEMMLTWAENCLGEGYLKVLSDGYASFVTDVNKSQMQYERNKQYRHSRFEDGCNSVYHNEEYGDLYHWGVFVTTFAWEHHLYIYDFFKSFLLGRYIAGKNGDTTVLDLGCGSGVWSLLLASALPTLNVVGVDISPRFVGSAEAMAEKNGLADRIRFNVADALTFRARTGIDFCISCFLLEHLESPKELLSNISRNLVPGGRAFITGALTAAEVDHITEFKQESELVLLAESCGFRVESTFSSAPPDYPQERYYLPRSMAMVLQKKRGDLW